MDQMGSIDIVLRTSEAAGIVAGHFRNNSQENLCSITAWFHHQKTDIHQDARHSRDRRDSSLTA